MIIRNRYRLAPALLGCLLLLTGQVWAQTSSANYVIMTGDVVGGGGSSGSTNYSMMGSVPRPASGTATSSSFTLAGGVIGCAQPGAEQFSYSGYELEIVPVADKTVKIGCVNGTTGVQGSFYYRRGGKTAYTAANMTAGNDDTLRYQLPASLLGVPVLEYYFVISKGTLTIFIGTGNAPYAFLAEFNNAQSQRPAPMPDAKYRIVGVPFDAQKGVRDHAWPSMIFEDDLGAYDKTKWRLGRYDVAADSVIEMPNLTGDVMPGRGYWLIARGSKKYGAAGRSLYPNRDDAGQKYYQVPLTTGWNQLANPFPFPIAWDDIQFEANGVPPGHNTAVLDDAAWWYGNNGWDSVGVIPAWEGFFVYIKAPGTVSPRVLFPFKEAPPTLAPPMKEPQTITAASNDNWKVGLRLEADGMVDAANAVGVRLGASDGADQYDSPELPLAPEGVRLALRLSGDERHLRRADYRAPFDDGAEWEIVFSKANERSFSATGLDQIPKNMEAWLILDVGTTVPLGSGARISLPRDTKTARLLIGTHDFVAKGVSEVLPEDYALCQNFPNPFNPSTSIRFALPNPGHVKIEVFNILGQQVATLLDQSMSAGYHTVVWNGNSGTRQVASGVYFYRLVTEGYQANRKMMLLK